MEHLRGDLEALNGVQFNETVIPQQLDNIRAAYVVLCQRVHTSLRTQVGDSNRLEMVRRDALSLLEAGEQVSNIVFLPRTILMLI